MAKKTSKNKKVSQTKEDSYVHPFARNFLWLANDKVVKAFVWVPVVGLALTIPLGIVYPFPENHKADWDFFASWAIIGFVAYSFVVLSAEPLFRMLSRSEDYYDEAVEPENIVAPKVKVHHHD